MTGLARAAIPCAAFLLATAACDDGGGGGDEDTGTLDSSVDTAGDTTGDPAGEEDAPADVPGEDGPWTGDMTVLVVWFPDGTRESEEPLEGAHVYLDTPSGAGRLTATTGSDGRATFEAVTIEAGDVILSAWKEGFAISTVIGHGTPGEEGRIELAEIPDETMVTVSGSFLNVMDPVAHQICLSANTSMDSYQDTGTEWSLDVPSGEPFTIMATEFEVLTEEIPVRGVAQDLLYWHVSEHAAVTEDTAFDLDMSETTDSETASGSFRLPTDPESLIRTSGTGYVMVYNQSGWAGFATRTDIDATGAAVTYEVDFVRVAEESEVVTRYTATVRGYGGSYLTVPGYPTEGEVPYALMDVPEILVPATPTTIHPIDEPMQWELSETGTGVIVQILDNEERLIWILALPPDATSVTVPEPPEDAVSAGLLDDALLQAHVMATSWYEEEEVSAYGYSRSIILDN